MGFSRRCFQTIPRCYAEFKGLQFFSTQLKKKIPPSQTVDKCEVLNLKKYHQSPPSKSLCRNKAEKCVRNFFKDYTVAHSVCSLTN